jgi:hypothetical protein
MSGRTPWAAIALVATACTAPPRAPAAASPRPALAFLESRTRPLPGGPEGADVCITDPTNERVAPYDAALAALVFMRAGERARAARLLSGMEAVQREDGALPFSFTLPAPDPARFHVRSGTIAWVGYAAAEYLDAEAGGPERDRIASLAHRAAAYLLAHQRDAPEDPRDGLVTGGFGTVVYELDHGALRERFVPGEVPWASVEHNVDAWFFFTRFAKLTGNVVVRSAADRIARALAARAWDPAHGQMVRGFGDRGPDPELALDCASWGALFFHASGDAARARTSADTADRRYASFDPKTRARGHLPHVQGPLLEGRTLSDHLGDRLSVRDWEHLSAVWPEGSAGAALAAARAGRPDRARAILDGLEPLRARDGSLPTFTVEVPFAFDTQPSVAGTAWVELVRFELARGGAAPTFLVP